MENHGTPFGKRWPILRERTLAMREIWQEDEAEFHGEFLSTSIKFGAIPSLNKLVVRRS